MWLRVAIFLLSAATLAYEILLTRLFAIIQWHHFASLVISLALLGYAVSGTFLHLARKRLTIHFHKGFLAGAIGFAVTSIVCFAVAQRIDFNPLEIVWTPRQLIYLALIQLLLAVPFFCTATAIGLTLSRFRNEIAVIYRADLLGAGAGVIIVLLALTVRRPEGCLTMLAAVALLAAAVASLDPRLAVPKWMAAITAVLAIVMAAIPQIAPALQLSPYKDLSRALLVPDTRIVLERSGPLGLLSVVESPTIPFRDAPGLSFAFPGQLPDQLGLFVDGEGPSAIDSISADQSDRPLTAQTYLDYLPDALPYRLVQAPAVALVGAEGGRRVRSALRHGAQSIDIIEPDRQLTDLLRNDLREFSGNLYGDPRVRLHNASARAFFARTALRFDLIQIALPRPGGAESLQPSSLLTRDAFESLLGRLEPDGLLAVGGPLEMPPRSALKLLVTAAEAIESRSAAADVGPSPKQSLALARSWDWWLLLVKRGEFSALELETIRSFCRERSFDLAYLPGLDTSQANRFNVLEDALFFKSSKALLGPERQRFLREYKFDVGATTDDRPYFFHSFKWRTFPELMRLRSHGGPALLDWSYLMLVAATIEAMLLGLFLVVLPLALSELRRAHPKRRRWPNLKATIYFFCLGLGFLFVEMVFIQKFTPFLTHPVIAFAVVVGSFLVFAGLGSGASQRATAWWSARHRNDAGRTDLAIEPVAGTIAGLVLIYAFALPTLFRIAVGWHLGFRVLLSIGLICPIAFLMGMPFPLGLSAITRRRPHWIPWAWGINGWASVMAALLTHLLAIHAGFSALLFCAGGLYVGAGMMVRSLD